MFYEDLTAGSRSYEAYEKHISNVKEGDAPRNWANRAVNRDQNEVQHSMCLSPAPVCARRYANGRWYLPGNMVT